MTNAAVKIVGFLQGKVPFEEIHLAPTVFLQVADSGGGDRVEVPAESLRSLDNWRVHRSAMDRDVSFVPSTDDAELQTRVGRHFNCLEYRLSDRARGVVDYPHVGTKLTPDEPDTCLVVWNVTFIFDPQNLTNPRLVGAVYDQWEW